MGSNHRSIIFGNGTLHVSFLKHIQKVDYIIGVDRGAYWLITHGIIPNLAIGDFDSTTPEELRLITTKVRDVRRFPPEKDQTDMELALSCAKKETIIFGGVGTRMDHTLATLSMITTQTVMDARNRIRKIAKGRTILHRGGYRYVSLIPLSLSIRVSLSGFRYSVSNITLRQGSSRGVSNEIIDGQAVVDIHAGKAWLIESND